MNNHQIGHSMSRVAITGLALLLAACGATPAKPLPQELDAQPHWPGLLADVSLDADQRDFRHRVLVTGIGESSLEDGTLTGAAAVCQSGNCRVSPGIHRLTIDYEWSSAKTRGDERAENVVSVLLFAALLMGGGGSGSADIHGDPGMLTCSVTLEVPFSEARQYRLSVSHPDQRAAPETLGVVDIESGEFVSKTDTCAPGAIPGEPL